MLLTFCMARECILPAPHLSLMSEASIDARVVCLVLSCVCEVLIILYLFKGSAIDSDIHKEYRTNIATEMTLN